MGIPVIVSQALETILVLAIATLDIEAMLDMVIVIWDIVEIILDLEDIIQAQIKDQEEVTKVIWSSAIAVDLWLRVRTLPKSSNPTTMMIDKG